MPYIEQHILDSLYNSHRDLFNLKDKPEVFSRLCLFIEEQLPHHFAWHSLELNSDALQQLQNLIELAEISDSNALEFNQLAVLNNLVELEQTFHKVASLHLLSDADVLGIQEKYVRGQLIANEPLSALDIKRMIMATDKQSTIKVSMLEETRLGLLFHQLRNEHITRNEPYSVGLLLKNDTQWLSLYVEIDPIAQKINYQIGTDALLSDEEKQHLKQLVQAALYFNQDSYTAYPDFAVIGTSKSLANEYQLVHDLYVATRSINDSELAAEFVAIPIENSHKIKQFIYRVELASMKLSNAEQKMITQNYPAKAKEFQCDLEDRAGQLSEETIAQQVNFVVSPSTAVTVIHPLVLEKVAEFQLYHTKIKFPDEGQNNQLNSIDYQQFIFLIQDKLNRSGISHRLNDFIIPGDTAALTGLIAYNEMNIPLPFKKITLVLGMISLSDNETVQQFLFNLRTLLLTSSANNLVELIVLDDKRQLTEYLPGLVQFVQSRGIVVRLTLPAYEHSQEQRAIDEAISDNRYKKNSQTFKKSEHAVSIDREQPKRQRNKIQGKQDIAVDIELQQEQQVEVAVETENRMIAGTELPSADEDDYYNKFRFEISMMAGEFVPESKAYLVAMDDLSALWAKWTGALNLEDIIKQNIRLSKAACEQIIRCTEQFENGLDLSRLPAGFTCRTERFAMMIDYNPSLKLISPYDPLQAQIYESPELKTVPHSLFERWLTNNTEHQLYAMWTLMSNAPYNKRSHDLFKYYLPELLAIRPADLSQLAQLCVTAEHGLNTERFQFLMSDRTQLKERLFSDKHSLLDSVMVQLFAEQADDAQTFLMTVTENIPPFHQHMLYQLIDKDMAILIDSLLLQQPSLGLNQLTQLYFESGESGIRELVTLVKDQALFAYLNQHVFLKWPSYAPLLTEEYRAAITTIKGFNIAERRWWDHLLVQHAQIQAPIHLIDLVNAFSTFKEQLKALSPEGCTLTLPTQGDLPNIKSMPVALSRMIRLLTQCSEDNREAQLAVLGGLDYSSTGMIYALDNSEKTWAFITPEMNINAQYTTDGDGEDGQGYRTPVNAASIREHTLMQDFFRCVAYQEKKEQLPLAFYLYAYNKIIDSDLSNKVKKELLVAVAAGTTGSSAQLNKSHELAKAHVDELVSRFVTAVPAPTAAMKEQFRTDLLERLADLPVVPALPIYTRLVTVIITSLRNPLSLVQNISKLNKAADELHDMVAFYGQAVYDGMKNYNDKDYQKNNLFFDYMETVKKIYELVPYDKTSMSKLLLKVISTFQLTAADVDEHLMHDLLAESQFSRREEALELLKYLSLTNKSVPLTGKDFRAIIQSVNNAPADSSLVDLFTSLVCANGTRLADYYPDEFLSNYGQKDVSLPVINIIKTHFNERQQSQIERILKRFSANGDAAHYITVVEKLVAITASLNPREKGLFIAKLSSSLGLYTPAQPLAAAENSFLQLLDVIIKKNAVDDFINFIAAERQLLQYYSHEDELNNSTTLVDNFFTSSPLNSKYKVVPSLAEKTVLFLNVLQPGLEQIKDLKPAKIDILPLIMTTLLKSPRTQLTEASSVVLPQLNYFKQQAKALDEVLQRMQANKGEQQQDAASTTLFALDVAADEQIDFTTLIVSTEALIDLDKANDNTNLKQYKASLERYQQVPELDPVDVHAIITNGPVILLLSYLSDTMRPEEKAVFEYRYGKTIKAQLEAHPRIYAHKELLGVLYKNKGFMQELTKKEVLSALASSQLLDDSTTLSVVFKALEQDLEAIVEFKKQSTHLKKEVKDKVALLNSYSAVFMSLVRTINQIISEYPASSKPFMQLYDRYLQHYLPPAELLAYQYDFVHTLNTAFNGFKDKNIFLSFCLHFNGDEPGREPQDLLALVQRVQQKNSDNQPLFALHQQQMLLKIAALLINNDKGYTLVDYDRLLNLLAQRSELLELLEQIYDKPPFPALGTLLSWLEQAEQAPNYTVDMLTRLEQFSREPAAREIEVRGKPVNGFHQDKAQAQLKLFSGFDGQIDVAQFELYSRSLHQYTVIQLLQQLDNLKNEYIVPSAEASTNNLPTHERLIALMAELLYRSKGNDIKNSDGSTKLGSSMEINTTQYLALLTSFNSAGHVTSQIGTGEGKSRLAMISLACLWAMGYTVDFVTSDGSLTMRDFVEFRSFFQMIGAKTCLISAQTDPAAYEKKGINFSDPSSLSLFRNKARSMGQGHLVLDEDASKRALFLDEGDKTYFDVADTRFNFSKEGEEHIRNMEWLYPVLMDYFAQDLIVLDDQTTTNPMDLYYADIDGSREKFLQFASSQCSKGQLMRLKALSNGQIEQWQVSAVTAAQLKFNEDFVIEPDVLINTPVGPKISSEAQLRFSGRVAKSSKFSFGVHQCLHARLNRALEQPEHEAEDLREALSHCEQPFYIADEKQIIYSSTSKNLVDDYKQGTLKAVTGTSGSIIERIEAKSLYGGTEHTMTFIDVPRDKGLNRRDKAIYLTRDKKAQVEALVAQIKDARSKKQPILIIAENDDESTQLFKELQQRFPQDTQLQRVHSQLSQKDENKAIERAGFAGQITVSTEMMGRGTDIALHGEAAKRGLNVMVTFLPRQRDWEQFVGRSGRFGAQGESVMILDKERLKKELGKTTLTDGFYTHTEAYVAREQALMDQQKQAERLIKNIEGDFRKKVTDNFFTMIEQIEPTDRQQLISIWTVFFDKLSKAWNEQWPLIQQELKAQAVDVSKINLLLDEYQQNSQKLWHSMRHRIDELDTVKVAELEPMHQLMQEMPQLVLNPVTTRLLLAANKKRDVPLKSVAYEHYDSGHDGRNVVYAHWYTPIVASLKGFANLLPFVNFEDARRPFANTRAWLEGRGQLFADFRASTNKAKIIGPIILGLLVGAIGAALMATGILAPLGITVLGLSTLITSVLIASVLGVTAGALVGLAGGAIVDAVLNKKEHTSVLDDADEAYQHYNGSVKAMARGLGAGHFDNVEDKSQVIDEEKEPVSLSSVPVEAKKQSPLVDNDNDDDEPSIYQWRQ